MINLLADANDRVGDIFGILIWVLIYGTILAIIFKLIRYLIRPLIKNLVSLKDEQKLMRIELANLAEEVHLIRKEIRGNNSD
jgi:flagellar biosynthesis/type III secretory pathway M-ring protein FliF/YscJ